MAEEKKQKQNTCRISKIPKSLGGKSLYEIRCTPKKLGRIIMFDVNGKKEATKTAKRTAKKYGIKKIYYTK